MQQGKCLFLDHSNRYGGHMSNFNLQHYFEYIEHKIRKEKGIVEEMNQTQIDEDSLPWDDLGSGEDGYHDFVILKQFDKGMGEDPATSQYSSQTLKDEFARLSKSFSIDLAPKIIFSRSTSVNAMIRSGVANYLEFQNVNDNFFYSQKEKLFVRIPFSKSEIF